MYKPKGIGTKFVYFLVVGNIGVGIWKIISNDPYNFDFTFPMTIVLAAVFTYLHRPETLALTYQNRTIVIKVVEDVLGKNFSLEDESETMVYFKLHSNPITRMVTNDALIEFGTDIVIIRCDAVYKGKIEKALKSVQNRKLSKKSSLPTQTTAKRKRKRKPTSQPVQKRKQ